MSQTDDTPRRGDLSGKIDQGMASLHEKIRESFSLQPVIVPFLAIVLAVIVGGLLVAMTGGNPFEAYWALLRGMFGGWDRIAASISRSTAYVGSALAVAFAFKAGLFNIGVEGQLITGGVAAGWVATWAFLGDTPGPIAIPIVLLAGVVAGGIWAGIPGVLRARTGAHEVISTIMLNNIAILFFTWIVNSRDPAILADPNATSPRTRPVAETARLTELVGSTPRLHLGTLVLIAMCVFVSFLLVRTVYGFEVRTTGTNPNAAHYAGISVNRVIVTVMLISGAIAGLTAAAEVSGTYHYFTPGSLRTIGFDGIAIALLARANPYGILPAALLWGSMLSGAGLMQQEAGVSIDVVRIVLSLVLLFVAADAIIRYLFRIKVARAGAPEAGGIIS
jgi:simple sugar transport system permease protein